MRSAAMFSMLLLVSVLQACSTGGGGAPDAGPVWKDPKTGLEWQREPAGPLAWQAATDYCGALFLDGRTGWKVPSISELRSLVRYCSATQAGGSCTVSDLCTASDCLGSSCVGCQYGPVPYTGCYWDENLSGSCRNWYWSATSVSDDGERAWYLGYNTATISSYEKTYSANIRCVNGGMTPPNDGGADADK